eukprot:2932992-Pleurochrysis_carterae.AAC.1
MAAMPVVSSDEEEYDTADLMQSERAATQQFELSTEELKMCAAMPADPYESFDANEQMAHGADMHSAAS